MTTLATMKARIASELRRGSTIDTQIASAISTAIAAYQHRRFVFNESRDLTFSTVADQEFYTSSDDADFGLIKKIDYVQITIDTAPYRLTPESSERLDWLSQGGTQTGQPLCYCWYGKKFRLYPVPSEVYTVRIAGHIKVAEPATDAETDNPWMIEGERLIRARAKYELAVHVLRDRTLAEDMSSQVLEAENQLVVDAARQQQQGDWRITPTRF